MVAMHAPPRRFTAASCLVTRAFNGVALLLVLVLIPGCGRDSSQRTEALATTPARQLVGVWDATFLLDRPIAPGTDPLQPPRHVTGSMAFLEDHVGSLSPEELTSPTHVGVYDIDFRVLGFQPHGPSGFPTVVARTIARVEGPPIASTTMPDSVSIVLDAGSSRFPLLLQGKIAADSVSGTWTAGQALGGGGRFSLLRRRAVP